MEELCKEEYYIEAFDTLMQAIDKNDISFDELQPLEWSIIIEATCLVLPGQIDKLIKESE